ncbi:poly-beta-1,6-N-acetyl-D-glucosamine N-deacetylase PgaB [Lysobacter arenosi]|uniref:Poly-beta-1,6-N-acetyl-D-glucosamine N-deacetylase PgaB n=1 Tax=Lysobacter arenosi TaxID=2795387 RepID=A0ABX7R8V0_9GAMM|nr:poly-beta-1,6-N-acetyl-D-glucosamine N-deacetylase PgaB [Lysobacter arenosi]QSX73846.1 poly-beta-1,6-N-acetyl-D-glucosamine N-deacetylase PgaB [Lysobacter arenosi]
MTSLVVALCAPVSAQPTAPVERQYPAAGQGFAVVALHRVGDRPDTLGEGGVSSEHLVAFFDWLAGNGWHAISLVDVERARRGIKPLPERAILITVDDGDISLYTRVYPLALAYRTPIVAAVVGQWLDVRPGGSVNYGGVPVPRSQFIDWNQAREMQASGLVEFASHSYDLHKEVLANPQGNVLPAATTRLYSKEHGYEDGAAYRTRLRTDLQHARDQIKRELGRAPRAIVWPFGRYGATAVETARELGFEYALTLDPQPGDAMHPMALGRYLPLGDPDLGTWVANIRFADPWPSSRRIVSLDPAILADADPAVTNERLGRVIERLLALGATDVLIDAAVPGADGDLVATWFPNSVLPMRQDLLPRLAAQLRGRANVKVGVRLPHRQALKSLGSAQRVVQLFADLAAHVPVAAVMVEDAAQLSRPGVLATDTPWSVREHRARLDLAGWPPEDALAMLAFRAVEAERPGVELLWLAALGRTPSSPSTLADVTLIPAELGDRDALKQFEWSRDFRAPEYRRMGVWWRGTTPPAGIDLATATRDFQAHGGTVLGWQPDGSLIDAPAGELVSPAVSALPFPRETRP